MYAAQNMARNKSRKSISPNPHSPHSYTNFRQQQSTLNIDRVKFDFCVSQSGKNPFHAKLKIHQNHGFQISVILIGSLSQPGKSQFLESHKWVRRKSSTRPGGPLFPDSNIRSAAGSLAGITISSPRRKHTNGNGAFSGTRTGNNHYQELVELQESLLPEVNISRRHAMATRAVTHLAQKHFKRLEIQNSFYS